MHHLDRPLSSVRHWKTYEKLSKLELSITLCAKGSQLGKTERWCAVVKTAPGFGFSRSFMWWRKRISSAAAELHLILLVVITALS